MKKISILMMVLTLVMTSSIGVFASEEYVSNMDSETFLELRLSQIDEALAEGKITEEEAILLREHIQEVAANGTFGNGPLNGNKGEGNVECILGEARNLGIFRSESAGQRLGNGNGVRLQKADGTGNQNRGKGNCRQQNN